MLSGCCRLSIPSLYPVASPNALTLAYHCQGIDARIAQNAADDSGAAMVSGLLKMAAQMQEGSWGERASSVPAAAAVEAAGRGREDSGVSATADAEASGRGREDSCVAAAAEAGEGAVHVAQEMPKGGRGREESGAAAAAVVPPPPVSSVSEPRAGKKGSQGSQGKGGAQREGPAAKDLSGVMSPSPAVGGRPLGGPSSPRDGPAAAQDLSGNVSPAPDVGGRPLGGPSLPMPASTAEARRGEEAPSLPSGGGGGAATQHSPAGTATATRLTVGQSPPPLLVVVSDDARLVRHLRALRAAGFAVVLVSSNAATLAAAEAMGETTAEGRARQRKPPSSGGVRERGGEAVAIRGEAGAAADVVLSWDAVCAGEYRTTTWAQ